jgi:hypothetical protein
MRDEKRAPMTIQEVFQKAVQKGYHVNSFDGVDTYFSGANAEWSVWTRSDNASSFMLRVEETFLDPAFWSSVFGTEGKERALTLIEHLFEGGSAESFFRKCDGPRRVKKRRLSHWLRSKPRCVHIFATPESIN